MKERAVDFGRQLAVSTTIITTCKSYLYVCVCVYIYIYICFVICFVIGLLLLPLVNIIRAKSMSALFTNTSFTLNTLPIF